MRVAFYAPMKSPDHPVPSGDREMARNLMKLLAHGERAHVLLASDLRTRDGSGDPQKQAEIMRAAQAEADRLSQDLPQDVSLWVTYHNYYKAPDLIGPAVAKARRLPYVLIESTRAQKRLTGPWADFARAAEAASDAADVIFYPTQHDRVTLERDRCQNQALRHLPPFLPLDAPPPAGQPTPGRLLSVGMMRPGVKMDSYRLIADALDHLTTTDWELWIAGDGPAMPEAQGIFQRFGDQIRFLGQLDREGLNDAYQSADILVWPGVNEAFGMTYLEAQSFGLPVVAQDRPGVRDVVAIDDPAKVEDGPAALAHRIARLVQDRPHRAQASKAAHAFVENGHLLPAAADRFWTGLAADIGAFA